MELNGLIGAVERDLHLRGILNTAMGENFNRDMAKIIVCSKVVLIVDKRKIAP